MLVFVDESGDTGLRLDQGSSKQFTVTLIVFPDSGEAEAASHRIDELRAALGLPNEGKGGEFHFNGNEQREASCKPSASSTFSFSPSSTRPPLPRKASRSPLTKRKLSYVKHLAVSLSLRNVSG